MEEKESPRRPETQPGCSAWNQSPVTLPGGQPAHEGTREGRRPRSVRDDEAADVNITRSADECKHDAPARATTQRDRRFVSGTRGAGRKRPMDRDVVADPSSHPALRDWSAGDSVMVRIPWRPTGLEGSTLEWRRRSAQALAFLLGGREGVRYGNWDTALEERPECLLDPPDTNTPQGRWTSRMHNSTVGQALEGASQ